MTLRRSFAFLLLIYCSAVLFSVTAAQEPSSNSIVNSDKTFSERYIFNVWDTDDGLPQVSVNSILQTRDGYLWLATYGGLARFDGVRFTVFDVGNTEGLKSNRITELFEDREGSLWIGTEMGGVSRLKDGKFTAYTKRDGLPDDNFGAIMQDRRGDLWMCSGDGLVRRSGEQFTVYTTRDGLPSVVINSVTEDQAGNVWVGTPKGVTRISAEGKFTVFTTADGLPHNNVQSVFAARDGKIWVGTYDGIASFDGERFSTYTAINELSTEIIKTLAEDSEGNLLIGTEGKGLYRMSRDGRVMNYTKIDGLSDSEARAVFEDAEGNLWVGTAIGGLNRLKRGKVISYTREDGLPSDSVVPITEDAKGSLWIGTNCGGLVRFSDGRFTTYTKRDGLPSNCVWSLQADTDGSLWLGTSDAGLTHFQDGKFTTYDTANSALSGGVVLALYRDRKGALWIGTDSGLNRYENGVFTVFRTSDGMVHDNVRFITEGHDGSLWIGTMGGFSRYKDGKFTNYTNADGLAHNFVRAIYEDGDGTLWIGTYGGGLNRFRDGRFTLYNTTVGLFDNIVSRIIEDRGGNLWMSGNRGIFRVSRNELNEFADGKRSAVTSVSYGVGDGMANHETNGGGQPAGWQTRDGRIWFPTVKGPVVIDPEQIITNERPPPVHIERMLYDKTPVDYKGGLEFPPGRGDLEISYTGLSFVTPEKVRFRYRLEGSSNEEWVEAGTRREAFYTNLAPGKYRFQVIAANNDGVWNEQGAHLEFEILPMFYQTNWFLLVCFGAFGALAWAGYQWRVRQVKSRLHLLYEERLSERTRIAQDLHDTLLQGIVSVSMHLDTAVNKLPPDSPAKSRLERMREMMRQIILEGRNTVNGLRSSGKLNANDLEQEFSRLSQQLNAQGKTNFRVMAEGLKRPFCPTIHEEIYHICREAIANAFRHSEAASIEVEMEYSKNFFKILIRDDGIGIDEGVLKTGREGHWGLSGMKERTEKIGAKLKVYSRTGAGTEIELIVPSRVAFETEKSIGDGSWLHKIFRSKDSA